MGKLAPLIKDDGENMIFTGHRLEALIPMNYANGVLYEENGDVITVFGIFPIRVFDANNKLMFEEAFNVPSLIYMYPTEVVREDVVLQSEIEDIDDEEELNANKFIAAKFYTGDVITQSNIPKDVDNTELFLKLLCAGKLPKISYSNVIKVWQMNLALNGLNIGITPTIQEVMVRELYRNPNKPEETFGEYKAKHPNVSDFNYKAVNIREICARNSTFAAISFEDMDAMITYSLNINKFNKKEKISPVEKIIKM